MITKNLKSILSNDNPYILFDGKKLTEKLEINKEEKEEFKSFWNELEVDSYMSDKGKYRKRRIAFFNYNRLLNKLDVIQDKKSFTQSYEINKFVGDLERVFSPSSNEFKNSPLLKNLIEKMVSHLPIENDSIQVNVHQIRILSSAESLGLPTPEGIHRDGHKFVSQHLISKNNILGGISGLYKLDKNPITHKMLNDFLDTIVLNDEKLMHDVSPVFSADENLPSYRDMLIIDYNF